MLQQKEEAEKAAQSSPNGNPLLPTSNSYPSPSSSTSPQGPNPQEAPVPRPLGLLEMGDYGSRTDVVWTNWPEGMPRPELLRHLYATPHPLSLTILNPFHQSRDVLHVPPARPTALPLPHIHDLPVTWGYAPQVPTPMPPSRDMRYRYVPEIRLGHPTNCPVASFYTAAVSSPPLPDLTKMAPGLSFRVCKERRITDDTPLDKMKYSTIFIGSQGPTLLPRSRQSLPTLPSSGHANAERTCFRDYKVIVV